MKAKAITITFLLTVFILAAINLIIPDRVFSENENRYLAGKPEFSLSNLLNGKFTEDFENYVTDQFPFREKWIGLKTLSEQLLAKKDSGGVYFADDNYLIECFINIDSERFEQNITTLADFTESVMSELGIEVQTMLVPTASYVLAEKLPKYTPEVDQSELLNSAENAGLSFVDVSSTLIEHRSEYIYYRTDHHWTSLGAKYAYEYWRALNGKDFSSENYNEEILSEDFLGTTYSKVVPFDAQPDIITAYNPVSSYSVEYNLDGNINKSIYEMSYLEKKDKYSVFFNANQSVTKVCSDNKNDEKLLIIKDSYANTFAQFAVPDYEEVHMIDLRYFKMPVVDYIKENGITDVLILYNLSGFSSDKDIGILSK